MKKKIILSTLLTLASLQSFGMQNLMPNGAAAPSCASAAAVETNAKFVHPREHEKQAFYELLLSKPWGKVSQQYITELQQEEKQLLEEFFQLADITQGQWEDYRKEINCVFEQVEQKEIAQSQLVSKKLIKKITDSLRATALVPDNFVITEITLADSAPMSASRNHIVIDLKRYNGGPWGQAEFITALHHELAHILHDDSFILICMDLIGDKKNLGECLAEFKVRFFKFVERRADMMACLCDPSLALAQIDTFNGHYDINPDHDDKKHPTPRETLAYSKEVYNKMLASRYVDNQPLFFTKHYGKIGIGMGMGVAALAGFAAYWWSTSSNGTVQPKST